MSVKIPTNYQPCIGEDGHRLLEMVADWCFRWLGANEQVAANQLYQEFSGPSIAELNGALVELANIEYIKYTTHRNSDPITIKHVRAGRTMCF